MRVHRGIQSDFSFPDYDKLSQGLKEKKRVQAFGTSVVGVELNSTTTWLSLQRESPYKYGSSCPHRHRTQTPLTMVVAKKDLCAIGLSSVELK